MATSSPLTIDRRNWSAPVKWELAKRLQRSAGASLNDESFFGSGRRARDCPIDVCPQSHSVNGRSLKVAIFIYRKEKFQSIIFFKNYSGVPKSLDPGRYIFCILAIRRRSRARIGIRRSRAHVAGDISYSRSRPNRYVVVGRKPRSAFTSKTAAASARWSHGSS
jgi:hypothetical protein